MATGRYAHSLLVWITLLAVGLRGLIPIGYMPDLSGQGFFILCDGIDHISHEHHHHDHAHHHGHSHDGHKHEGICPFSIGTIYSLADFRTPLPAPAVMAFGE